MFDHEAAEDALGPEAIDALAPSWDSVDQEKPQRDEQKPPEPLNVPGEGPRDWEERMWAREQVPRTPEGWRAVLKGKHSASYQQDLIMLAQRSGVATPSLAPGSCRLAMVNGKPVLLAGEVPEAPEIGADVWTRRPTVARPPTKAEEHAARNAWKLETRACPSCGKKFRRIRLQQTTCGRSACRKALSRRRTSHFSGL
jgi:hypothetical protein